MSRRTKGETVVIEMMKALPARSVFDEVEDRLEAGVQRGDRRVCKIDRWPGRADIGNGPRP